MKTKPLILLALLGVAASCTTPPGAPPPAAVEAGSDIDSEADQLLKRMSETLRNAEAFSFRASAFYDEVLPTGLHVQRDMVVDFVVRRPDGLRVALSSRGGNRVLSYDGKTVTLLEEEPTAYGRADAPATLDAALDMLAKRHGVLVPLSDLLRSDPYAVLTEGLRAGSYVGTMRVAGVETHQLVFSQKGLNLQIWVAMGDEALPIRVVLTYLDERGIPQFAATTSNWDLSPYLADDEFEVEIPEGAKRIDLEKSRLPTAGARR